MDRASAVLAMTPANGRAFLKLKFAWLDQVLSDPKISPEAFQLAYLLATRFLDRKSGQAWPSQRTLAALLHVSERQVRRLSRELERAGLVTVTVANQQHVSNRYRPIVRADNTVPPETVQGGQFSPLSSAPGRTNPVIQGGQVCPPTPLKRTLKSSHNGNSVSGAVKTYAFDGRLIRLDQAQLEKWRTAYPSLLRRHRGSAAVG